MKIFKNKISICVLSILATLIIERFFSPFVEWLYSIFLNIISSFFSSFSDSIYQSIAKGYADQASMIVLYLLTLAFGIFLSANYANLENILSKRIKEYDEIERVSSSNSESKFSNSKKNTDITLESAEEILKGLESDLDAVKKSIQEINKKNKTREKRLFVISKLSFLLIILFILFIYGKQAYINGCITKTLCNIEIVSPYLEDEKEYHKLKSQFHSIKNQQDYEDLHNELNYIADLNGVQLN